MRFSILLVIAAALAPGCTAINASYHLVDAEITVNKSRDYGADVHAVYEYTMALRYLDKAREENGYSEYKLSAELAQTAAEWADQAVISMDERGLKKGDPPALLPGQAAPASTAPADTPTTPPAPTGGGGYKVPAPGGG